MINGNDEQNLEYLLDPCFQIVNTHGAPLTSGWLEVYVHGTRTKYYCASDFDGTLHPFKIPLDSLGSNIVLADPSQSYDVYVYNKYGTLQMSRYNVKPGSGSGSGQIIIDDKPISRIQVISNTLDGPEWVGTPWKYALTEVVGDKLTWRQDGEDMNLGNVYAKAGTYHYDFIVKVDWTGELRNEIVRFQILGINPSDRDTWHSFDLSYPHTEFYHFSSFSNRMAGYEDRIFVDLDISPYGGAPAGLTATVETLTIFSIEDSVSVHTGLDRVHHDDSMTGDGTPSNPLSISSEVEDLQEQIDGKQDELTPGEGISIINNVISCSAHGETYTAGQYVDITPENVINVSGLQPAGEYLTPDDLNGYATTEDVESATSGKLDTSAYTAPVQSDWNQSDSEALDFIKNKPTIPSLDGYATEQYVVEQTSGKMDTSAYEAPVQSDWNDTDPEHLSYIKNKPTECGLIAGQNVWFEDLSSGLRINCSGGGSGSEVTEEYVQEAVESATSGKLDIEDYTAPVQSDWNQSNSDALDFIKNKPTIPSLDGYATQEYVQQNVSGKMDTSAYEAPVQSDWSQANASMLDFIKNKPESSQLLAGPGISITESGNDYMISSTGGSGDVTKQYVDEAIESATSGKLDTSAYTAPVQSDWSQPDAAALSFIKNKPTECSLLAGENVWIEDTTSGVRINCSAQGGGGPVPEGVMTESELKYNAVGEISGYGDSAIAQYGAEKQWLVHDDTIVHMSNSAQYAFGVNLSAVAQLLGIDETVLWEGSDTPGIGTNPTNKNYTLSGTVDDFDHLKIIAAGKCGGILTMPVIGSRDAPSMLYVASPDSPSNTTICGLRISLDKTDRSTINFRCGYSTNWADAYRQGQDWGYFTLYKIVGIGRKQST